MKRVALATLVATTGTAVADPDLRVHHLPVQLHMRTAQTPTAEPATPSVTHVEAPTATAFTALPTSVRDAKERLIFKLRAGAELDGAVASGEPLRGGASLNGFESSRQWIVGDAVVGARDLLVPSLGGYFLSAFQLDAGDTAAERSALVVPGDATGQRIAIKAGYVEYGNDDRRPDHKLWLRGGRQYRLDGGALFAYFDGLTVGYRDHAWNASAFVGQRVSLYVDTERGVLYGATAAFDLQKAAKLPLRIAVDAMGLSVAGALASGTDVAPSSLGTGDRETRMVVAVTATSQPIEALELAARVRFADAGSRLADDANHDGMPDGTDPGGLALGRIGARATYSASKQLLVVGDVEHRGGGDLAYDLAAPSAVDVVDVARRIGVGLADPIAATTIGARIDWRHRDLELLGFGRTEIPSGTALTVDQKGWVEAGAAVAGAPIGARAAGLWATLQYKFRTYSREDAANLMGSAFSDTAGSGLDRLHELAADAVARGKGKHHWRASIGAYYRVYDQRTPYVEVTHEGRAGGRADVQWWFSDALRVDVAGEVAQSAPEFERELGTLSAVRASFEARW